MKQEERPLTASDMRAQVNRVQEVMKAVMQEGQHYGRVPGCGDKPTLLKPGAEKLMMTFRLAADPLVDEIPTDDGRTFRVTCRITHQMTGLYLGSGVGECSTKEEKYNWRSVTGEPEWNATPEDRRRIKYGRDYQTKQVRTNPADLANTVLKMAKKRALVDAILTVTGASDIFTQDIEEIPSEYLDKGKSSGKPATSPPQSKSSPASGEVLTTSGIVENVTYKTGGEGKKVWTKYAITISGETYSTFDKTIAENAKAAKDMDIPVRVEYTTDKFGHNIQSLVTTETTEGSEGREPGSDDE